LRAVAFEAEAVVLLHCHVAAIEFTVAAGKHATFCGQAHDTCSPGDVLHVLLLLVMFRPTGRMGDLFRPQSDKLPTEISARFPF